MMTYTIPGWLFCPKWADLQLCQLCTFKIDELLVQHLAFGSTYLLSCLFSEEKPDVSKPDPFALISECLGDVNEMFWLCHKFSLTVVQGHKPLCFWGTTGPPLSISFFFLLLPSAALPALLTDLSAEKESAASGSRLLVGTVRNKSWLLKSALICVSWRGDCLQQSCGNTFVTVCALCIISPCVKKSCFASFALYLYFAPPHIGPPRAQIRMQTHAWKSTHFFPATLIFPLFFLRPPTPFLSLHFFPPFWLPHTLIPFLQGQASHGTSSE